MNLALNWRLKDQRYRLEGTMCGNCGAKHFPPREVCTECKTTQTESSAGMTPHEFDGHGELYSFTVLRSAPIGYEGQLPYAVGMIKLDEGPMVEAQITDVNFADLEIGERMEAVTRKLLEYGEQGLIVYGYKFRPRAE